MVRTLLASLLGPAVMMVSARMMSAQEPVKFEVLGATVERSLTGGYLGDGVRALDTTTTKLAVLTVRVPRGTPGGISTSDLRIDVTPSGGTKPIECEGYAPVKGGWMFVNRKTGMSSLTFYAGGTGTIDMRLLFPVPRSAASAQFMYKGAKFGDPVLLPSGP